MVKIVSLLILGTILGGCAQKGPSQLTLEQVPAALRQAFASSKTKLLQTSAESAARLVAEKLYAAASLQLQALAGNTDLTDEQRSVVAGATIAVNAALQEIAAGVRAPETAPNAPDTVAPPEASKDDAAAAKAVLEHYKRTK